MKYGAVDAQEGAVAGEEFGAGCGAVGGGLGVAGANDLANEPHGEIGLDDAADLAGFGVLGGGDDVDAERAAEADDAAEAGDDARQPRQLAQFVNGKQEFRLSDLALDALARFSSHGRADSGGVRSTTAAKTLKLMAVQIHGTSSECPCSPRNR